MLEQIFNHVSEIIVNPIKITKQWCMTQTSKRWRIFRFINFIFLCIRMFLNVLIMSILSIMSFRKLNWTRKLTFSLNHYTFISCINIYHTQTLLRIFIEGKKLAVRTLYKHIYLFWFDILSHIFLSSSSNLFAY